MKTICIGVAATRRNMFDFNEAVRHKNRILKYLKQIDGLTVVDIDDINAEGLLYNRVDTEKIIQKFIDAGVDGVFFPHVNFGTEFLVGEIAKRIGKPVLIWGPRDDAPLEDGARTRDTQCGLFATGKVLRRFGVPFTYIVNEMLESDIFRIGFLRFVSVCSVVKSFRDIRILQISTRPADFWTMMVSEGELLEKFGIRISPIALTELLQRMDDIEAEKPAAYSEALLRIGKLDKLNAVSDNAVRKLAAMKVAIEELACEAGAKAVVLQCWSALQKAAGVMPCLVNGLLTAEDLPVLCETDIHGAVSSILLSGAVRGSSAVFFADLTVRHPVDENAELLWHCGNFPPSLCEEGDRVMLGCNAFNATGEPGTGNFGLKKGDVTMCRFDGDNGEYRLFTGQGKIANGPRTLGTYGWLEVPDWEKWEYQLVTGPYVHHIAGAYGRVSDVLYEACKYIPGLIPDPADPTKEQIEHMLIHGN